MSTIAGTIPMIQDVDSSGSFTINVPLQLPDCRFQPTMALAYHSAATGVSALGRGWALKGASIIERVPATVAQDGFHGVIGYNANDRFALDGQRLIQITAKDNNNRTEYRFEIERWSRIFAIGKDLANPTSWEQWLPDGTIRKFGTTDDSNIHGLGSSFTRVWAISEESDPFTNSITFKYLNDDGAFYLASISYGGNAALNLKDQRVVAFSYESREDINIEYVGGLKVRTQLRLAQIQCSVEKILKWSYKIGYDYAPLTSISRIISIALVDTNGTMVEPLKFTWSNGNPKVFDETRTVATLTSKAKIFLVTTMDVDAEGHSDLVVASMCPNSANGNKDELYLDIFLATSAGQLLDKPTSGSGFTGLYQPKHLLPFDVDGDGQTDLLHISSSPTDGFSLTLLLSDGKGFTRQPTTTFKPASLDGSFHMGDFKGDGKVELVYVYLVQKAVGGQKILQFVHFRTDGKQLTAEEVQDGPTSREGFTLDNFKVVVGDLNGDGSDDLFIFAPRTDTSQPSWMIYFIESVDGNLQYQPTDPLQNAGKVIPYNVDSTILPFRADSDGKTSMVVLSKNGENLQFQILRSLGYSLLADPSPTATRVRYGGIVVTVKVISQNTVNLVSLASDGLHLFRFSGDTFIEVSGITQPTNIPNDSSIFIRWADLRGVGRSDCLFSSLNPGLNVVTVRSLQSSGSQPLDRVLTSTNGLGAVTTVSYGPLTDPDVYEFKSQSNKQPTSLMNASANNSVSISGLFSNSTKPEHPEATRADVIYYPTFVVRSIFTKPGATGGVYETFQYTYSNAKIDFDGRGWLGFLTIVKKGQESGITEERTYSQTFPLAGMVLSSKKADGDATLEDVTYTWAYTKPKDVKNFCIALNAVKETYFESGQEAYSVDVAYASDSFGNIIQTSIKSSQPNSTTLTISSTYQEPSLSGSSWTVGNKKTEDVKNGASFLRRTTLDYVSGTTVCKETRRWIAGDQWETTELEFDKAGNRTSLTGPFVYDRISTFRQEFTYDSSYSRVKSQRTRTGIDKYLVENTTFDLATSLLKEVEKPNGLFTTFSHDLLGRKIQVSEGPDKSRLDVMEKITFGMQNSVFFEKREINNGLIGGDNARRIVITFFDGLLRPLSIQKSRPDDLASLICIDTTYDELGRVSSRSRDYFSGSTPQFFQYSYDKHSRLIQEILPPNKAGGAKVIHSLEYGCQAGVPSVSEKLSDGTRSNHQPSIRQFSIIPNVDAPSPGNFVKLCVAKHINENGQTAQTSFDALARPIKIEDASGVQLTLSYDGLSRQIERKLVTGSASPITFSHFRLSYDVGANQDLLLNVLTRHQIFTETDFSGRIIRKVSDDEDIDFFYDSDKFSSGQLSKVSSNSSGQIVDHIYAYDSRGKKSSATIKLDGRTFVTKYAWTVAGQLLKVINPESDTISQTYFPDGTTLKKSELTILDNTFASDNTGEKPVVVKASVSFSGLENAYGVPTTWTYGNGLTSKVSMIDSGAFNRATLTKSDQTVLLDQKWDYDAFNKIVSHELGSKTSAYQYDNAGQIREYDSANFEYDNSGNIKTKGDLTFINDGWQLTSITTPSGTSATYEYTLDGNVKTVTTGSEKTSISYDSDGRVKKIDSTSFLYDYAGRLLKTTADNGEAVIYVSPTFEVKAPKDPKKEVSTSYLVGANRLASYTTYWDSPDNVVSYFHHDQLGSTVAVSDSKGSITAQYSYDALGNIVNPPKDEDKDISRYTYCGKELFGSFYYFGSRFYDSRAGRFLTLDNYPIDIDHISPSSFNLYLFSRNDPINYIDVNGNGPVPWWHWIVDAVLIGVGAAVTLVAAATGNFALGVIGSTALGAGVSGLLADIGAVNSGQKDGNAWGTQLGYGALFGLLGGLLGGLGGIGVRSASKAILPTAIRNVFKGTVTKALLTTGLEVGIGAAAGAGQQVLTNYSEGDPLGKDVASSAALGGIFGFVFPGRALGAVYSKGRILLKSERAHKLLSRFNQPTHSVQTGSPNWSVQLARGRSSYGKSLNDEDLHIVLHHIDI